MTALTPMEQLWLGIYRQNPEIGEFLERAKTGQISLNVHEGRLVTTDLREHRTLRQPKIRLTVGVERPIE